MPTPIRRKLLWIVVLAAGGGLASPACGYIDYAPTLGQLIKDSTHIVVIRVDKVSQEKRAILFQKVADLKGKFDTEKIYHQITDGTHPREPHEIMDWAEPGQVAGCGRAHGQQQHRKKIHGCISRFRRGT